jgi:GNAT superfamily N-acetyltransferase
MSDINFVRRPTLTNQRLNGLFESAWPSYGVRNFVAVLDRSVVYVAAFSGDRLVGFVNVAWDGGLQEFVIDPVVEPEFRRQGIGSRLLAECVAAAADSGLEWLHVDFDPELESFYRKAGFSHTLAGVVQLR